MVPRPFVEAWNQTVLALPHVAGPGFALQHVAQLLLQEVVLGQISGRRLTF